MLIFATVAALALTKEWELGYSELIPYATPGLIAFGVFSLPAGWLADRWSREGVMGVFFVGIGLAAIGTSFVQNPIQMAIGLFIIGMFCSYLSSCGLGNDRPWGSENGTRYRLQWGLGQYGSWLCGTPYGFSD